MKLYKKIVSKKTLQLISVVLHPEEPSNSNQAVYTRLSIDY